MQITVIVDKTAFDSAIGAAERVGRSDQTIKGLQAPLDGALTGWVEEAWEAVREALERAYQSGAEAAQSAIASAEQAIERVLSSAGKRAADVAVALRAKLSEYISALIDEMLKQVRPNLVVGQGTLRLAEIAVAQKLVLGGSLKTSLQEALALTSNTEFNIQASYRAG